MTPEEFAAATAKTVARRAGQLGRRAGAHPRAQGRGGFRHLHARLRGRPAGQHPQQLQGAPTGLGRRKRDAARAHPGHGVGPAGAGRHRGRPGAQPRAHPALQHPGERLAAGQDLDIAKLILAVQKPPFRQVGVFDVDTFFPEKDRFGLAMALNNIIASPSFGAWMQGEPLDIGRAAAHADRQAPPQHLLHRPPERCRAHVLRHHPAGANHQLDARPARHHQPARAALHGRDLRLLPADGQPAEQAADADAARSRRAPSAWASC